MYDKNTLFENGRICAFPMWGTKYYPLSKSAHRIFFNVSEIYSEHDYPQDAKNWVVQYAISNCEHTYVVEVLA